MSIFKIRLSSQLSNARFNNFRVILLPGLFEVTDWFCHVLAF